MGDDEKKKSKGDLTRLEDLSQYEHTDSEIEGLESSLEDDALSIDQIEVEADKGSQELEDFSDVQASDDQDSPDLGDITEVTSSFNLKELMATGTFNMNATAEVSSIIETTSIPESDETGEFTPDLNSSAPSSTDNDISELLQLSDPDEEFSTENQDEEKEEVEKEDVGNELEFSQSSHEELDSSLQNQNFELPEISTEQENNDLELPEELEEEIDLPIQQEEQQKAPPADIVRNEVKEKLLEIEEEMPPSEPDEFETVVIPPPSETEIKKIHADAEKLKKQTDSPNLASVSHKIPVYEDEPFAPPQLPTPPNDIFGSNKKVIEKITSEPKEDFKEVKSFVENFSYDENLSYSPQFSLLVSGIEDEDSHTVFEVLEEFELVDQSNASVFQKAIDQGQVLISRLGEYKAICMAQKFRRFPFHVHFGLAQEVHPRPYRKAHQDMTSARNIMQNTSESFSFEKDFTYENVIVTTLSQLDGYSVKKYLGIITESYTALKGQLEVGSNEMDSHSKGEGLGEEKVNIIYQNLVNALKRKTYKMGGNAVLGLSYQMTPLLQTSTEDEEVRYKVLCSGNCVIVQ